MNCSEFSNLLDPYVDGELDEAQCAALKSHADACDECRAALTAAEQLRGILSHIDDGLGVPLPAQAAWRNAIRAEARRKRMKRVYSICGAVAAVCVLTLGVTAMLRPGIRDSFGGANVVVETDGLSQDAVLEGEKALRSMSGMDQTTRVERAVCVQNAEEAHDYLMDIVAEYGGTVTQDSGDEVYVQVPGENVVDFLSAVDGLGIEPNADEEMLETVAERVEICVTITEE